MAEQFKFFKPLPNLTNQVLSSIVSKRAKYDSNGVKIAILCEKSQKSLSDWR